MEDQQSNYLQSQFLLREAIIAEGEIIADVWQAIIEREGAIDEIESDVNKRESLEAARYLEKANRATSCKKFIVSSHR